MQNAKTCPVCRHSLPPQPESGQPVAVCPRCRPRPRFSVRLLQTLVVVGLLAATMGAAGVFAILDCPCLPSFRHQYRIQEIDKLPPEPPPPPPDAPPPPAEGGGAKLLPPTTSGP
jgi:hypothetical protein